MRLHTAGLKAPRYSAALQRRATPPRYRPALLGVGPVPPLRQALLRRRWQLRRVMRRVVEQDQPRAHGVAEVEHVEARRILIEPIPIAARVEPEQAAQEQADRRL